MAQAPRELTPYASLRHFFGAELRQWRQRAGLSHDRLGKEVNYSGDTIGKVEKGERAPSAQLVEACDRVLQAGGALSRLFGLVEHATTNPRLAGRAVAPGVGAAPVAGGSWDGSRADSWALGLLAQPPDGSDLGGRPAARSSAGGDDEVDRQEFLIAMFGAGAGAVAGTRVAAEPSRLGSREVAAWRQTVARLYKLDDEYGGGCVLPLTVRSLRRVRRLLQRASYASATGQALQAVAGELSEHCGWLAFDAGRQADARYWWLEASHSARLAEDDRVLVVVLASMSLQARDLGQAGEAVELARAAQRAATSWGTPRLRSLLAAREAQGHARDGNEQAAWQALGQAGALLEQGRRDEDPSWLNFWDGAVLAGCELRVACDLGKLPLADRAAGHAVAAVRPAYPRNRAHFLAQHAEVLVKQQRVEEAASTATQAAVLAKELTSGRVDAYLHQVRAELARYPREPGVAEFLHYTADQQAGKPAGWAPQV